MVAEFKWACHYRRITEDWLHHSFWYFACSINSTPQGPQKVSSITIQCREFRLIQVNCLFSSPPRAICVLVGCKGLLQRHTLSRHPHHGHLSPSWNWASLLSFITISIIVVIIVMSCMFCKTLLSANVIHFEDEADFLLLISLIFWIISLRFIFRFSTTVHFSSIRCSFVSFLIRLYCLECVFE